VYLFLTVNQQDVNKTSTSPQQALTKVNTSEMAGPSLEGLRAGLEDAIARTKGRSKTALLRAWFSVIEEAREAGVPNTEIVNELNKHGLAIDVRTFAVLMSRIRKRNNRSKTTAVSPISCRPDVTTPKATGETSAKEVAPLTQSQIRQISQDRSSMDEYL
jgi:hypothetical protein